MEHTAIKEQSLDKLMVTFFTDLAYASRSPYARHAYAVDLAQFCAFSHGRLQAITTELLQNFLSTHLHLRPATRTRKHAAVARFLAWMYQCELLDPNPMLKIELVELDPPHPRGMKRDQIECILTSIPAECLRDRLFFRLFLETGLWIGGWLSLYVEDLDLSFDNEHLTVVGNGGKRRSVLLEDPHLVQQLRTYLKRMGYTHGPLFRAEKNGRGGPLLLTSRGRPHAPAVAPYARNRTHQWWSQFADHSQEIGA
jgi:integrase/recombinase XerD